MTAVMDAAVRTAAVKSAAEMCAAVMTVACAAVMRAGEKVLEMRWGFCSCTTPASAA